MDNITAIIQETNEPHLNVLIIIEVINNYNSEYSEGRIINTTPINLN